MTITCSIQLTGVVAMVMEMLHNTCNTNTTYQHNKILIQMIYTYVAVATHLAEKNIHLISPHYAVIYVTGFGKTDHYVTFCISAS